MFSFTINISTKLRIYLPNISVLVQIESGAAMAIGLGPRLLWCRLEELRQIPNILGPARNSGRSSEITFACTIIMLKAIRRRPANIYYYRPTYLLHA